MGFYSKRVGYIPLEIDKIYTSKKEMDENFSTDGVFIGRFVLVDYGDPYISLDDYNANAQKDDNTINVTSPQNVVNDAYDNTIWQKTKDGYVKVANLNSQTPAFKYSLVEPGYFDTTGNKDFAERIGTMLYDIKVSKPWEFKIASQSYGNNGFTPQNYHIDNPSNKMEISLNAVDTNNNSFRDTQQLTINFSRLGETVSQMWDNVLGNYRNGLKNGPGAVDYTNINPDYYDNSMLGRVNYALARINAAAEVIDNVLIYAEPISETAWEILINKKIKDGLNTDRDTILEIAQFFVGANPSNQTLADIQDILNKIPEGDPFSLTDGTKRKFVLRAGDTMTGNLQFGIDDVGINGSRPVIKYFGVNNGTDYGTDDPPTSITNQKRREGQIYFKIVS